MRAWANLSASRYHLGHAVSWPGCIHAYLSLALAKPDGPAISRQVTSSNAALLAHEEGG